MRKFRNSLTIFGVQNFFLFLVHLNEMSIQKHKSLINDKAKTKYSDAKDFVNCFDYSRREAKKQRDLRLSPPTDIC